MWAANQKWVMHFANTSSIYDWLSTVTVFRQVGTLNTPELIPTVNVF